MNLTECLRLALSYRLLLREDNADLRLSPLGIKIGLLDSRSQQIFESKVRAISSLRAGAEGFYFYPTSETNSRLEQEGLTPLKDRASAEVLLRRPEVDFKVLSRLGFHSLNADSDVLEQVEIQVKYQGYIQKDMQLLEGVRNAEMMKIPVDFEYGLVAGLSNEVKGKLKEIRPENLGQASRVQGVTPAAVANLMIYLKNKHGKSMNTHAG